MKLLIITLLLCGYTVAEAQLASRTVGSHRGNITTVFKSDSMSTASYIKDQTLAFSIENPSTTDTLKVAFCLTWADTTKFIRIPPGKVFNYERTNASWIRWLSRAGSSGTINGVTLIFY